jgi:hypothetical protein
MEGGPLTHSSGYAQHLGGEALCSVLACRQASHSEAGSLKSRFITDFMKLFKKIILPITDTILNHFILGLGSLPEACLSWLA